MSVFHAKTSTLIFDIETLAVVITVIASDVREEKRGVQKDPTLRDRQFPYNFPP